VMLDMMGLPAGDMDRIKAWCDAWGMLLFAPLPPDQQKICAQGARDYHRYITELVVRRRARLGDDFISALVQAPMEGQRLSDGEYAAQIAGTIFAGNESTTCLIGSAVHILLKQPELWATLRAQPAPLARLEARIALDVLTTRLPQPRIANQPIPYIPGLLRGPLQLSLEWDVSTAH
jgi:cytochrome P450